MLSKEIKDKSMVWTIRNQVLDFTRKPFVMGILNVTPDSFSDGGRYFNQEHAVKQALLMEKQGADIIDVGGESTRPGSDPVSLEEELRRVIPVIQAIRQRSEVLISVDTNKAIVAEQALQAGADIVNDVSAARFDPDMAAVVKNYNCPLVIMHMKGKPKNMQQEPYYDDVVAEIYHFFEERLQALTALGIDRLILDPGIGFGKRVSDNLEIIRSLATFNPLGYPLLIGLSRKSFIGKLLNREVEDRLAGTIAANLLAVQNGAHILRVHDVPQTMDLLHMWQAIQKGKIL